ncbi:4-alpha-glucanotransferase [Streptomyces katsurahamanus]|uniref:4-alpha-glucanotransferase n=1 Tax=Streptomyces katsurahamanus TaxID=2577098 RepID=A0ABW9NU01_9ACTN|nr:4-alpha-glucanotransferase [Streptomyces katsurahamanus]MQS36544.1 4-alpha-glucanotransferase [Streptomyces katsurahamanus]
MSLARLAALHGVAVSHAPPGGVTVPAPETTVVAILAALGVDATSPAAVQDALDRAESAAARRLLPATVVRWHGESEPRALAELPDGTELTIALEDGGDHADWREAPCGVHRLTARSPDGRTGGCVLIVAPERAPHPPRRSHGFLLQLYSLLSARSWGMGDLGDLAEFAAWSGRSLGTGFLQVNPLHAAVPAGPGGITDPSPYRPSSRRFPDPVHLRIADIPEYAEVSGPDRERLDLLREQAAGLRTAVLEKGALIDRDAVWALKRAALELVRRVPQGPGRRAAYCDFVAARGRPLDDHATWCALAERHGPHWRSWPAELRDPRSPGTARARRELMDRIDFHSWALWLTDRQLAEAARAASEAGMGIGIVHDLAVGVHPDGADAWAQGEVFAPGMSVGAPPDAFNGRGQDWGLPPWRPDVLASLGYEPFRELLRGLFAHAGAVRIDHVMGLFRLWWVPAGCSPTEGAYVGYDAEAMLAVLVLEAHRAGAVVVGEDLGTVEPGVRETLARRGVLGASVLWFERDWGGSDGPLPPGEWREECVATATTHDLPPTAARLNGEHTELRDRLGLLTRPLREERLRERADVREWLRLFQELGLLPEVTAHEESLAQSGQSTRSAHGTARAGGAQGLGRAGGVHEEGPLGAAHEEALVRAVHRFLLATPARMVGVWLPDAVGDRRPQNVPGTWDQYPNWRLPMADAEARPLALEQLARSPRLHALMELFPGGPRRDDGEPAL